MEKRDPYKHRERYLKWRQESNEGIKGISEESSRLILNYLDDMEMGINVSVSSKKSLVLPFSIILTKF